MRAVWNPLLERKEHAYELKVNEIIEDVDLGQQLGLENLNVDDINEGLTFDSEKFENEDLF